MKPKAGLHEWHQGHWQPSAPLRRLHRCAWRLKPAEGGRRCSTQTAFKLKRWFKHAHYKPVVDGNQCSTFQVRKPETSKWLADTTSTRNLRGPKNPSSKPGGGFSQGTCCRGFPKRETDGPEDTSSHGERNPRQGDEMDIIVDMCVEGPEACVVCLLFPFDRTQKLPSKQHTLIAFESMCSCWSGSSSSALLLLFDCCLVGRVPLLK